MSITLQSVLIVLELESVTLPLGTQQDTSDWAATGPHTVITAEQSCWPVCHTIHGDSFWGLLSGHNDHNQKHSMYWVIRIQNEDANIRFVEQEQNIVVWWGWWWCQNVSNLSVTKNCYLTHYSVLHARIESSRASHVVRTKTQLWHNLCRASQQQFVKIAVVTIWLQQ